MRKIKPTGAAVIYTAEGAKIIDAEVRHFFNCHGEWYKFKFNFEEKYLLIGGARTVPSDNIHAAKCRPEAINQAFNFTQTKFFRLMLDLMRLAQFETIHKDNYCFESDYFQCDEYEGDIDFSARVEELDAQFYKKNGFSEEMKDFVERRYRYDDVSDRNER